jgi:PAS domain S-box-containing protein
VLGLVAYAGWCLGLPTLIRLHPALLPMQADTALGFVAAGLALRVLGRGRRWLALALASVLVLYASLSVIEFTLRADFGLHHWHTGGRLAVTGVASTPMARATGVLFAWFGMIVVSMALVRERQATAYLAGVGGAAMLSAACLGLGARLFGFVPDAQWMREASHMAWQTLGGMVLLAAALVVGSVTRWRRNRVQASLPAIQIAVCAVACSTFFWQVTVAHDRALAEREMGAHADAVQRRLTDRVTIHTEALERMAGRLEFAGRFDAPAFEHNSVAYLRHAPDLLALAFADASGIVREVVPLAGHESVRGLRLGAEPTRAAALQRARWERGAVVSGHVRLRTGQLGFLALQQVGIAGRQGFVIAVFALDRLLDVTAGGGAAAVVLADGQVIAATRTDRPRGGWSTTRTLAFGSEPWTLRVSFGPASLSPSLLSRLVLTTGMAISALLSGVTFLLIREWRRNAELTATRQELTDIVTEQGETQRILWDATTLHTAILDSANCSIVSSDADGVIQTWNATAERWLGYSSAEVVGQQGAPILHVREELVQRASELSAELQEPVPPGFDVLVALARRGRSDERDWTYVRRDGSRFPVRLSMTALHDFEGQVTGFLGVATDMTEPTRIQAELRQARDAALAATQAKSAFLATMSHEIRTPIAGVIGLAGMLLESELPDESRDLARTLQQSSENLLAIINDVLDFSKIEAGALTLEEVDLDLRATVEGVVDLLSPIARAKGLSLDATVASHVPSALLGDPHRLRQILLNLVGNAIKFTASGSVSIRVTSTEQDGAIVVTTEVADTGVGIAPDAQARLFKAYVQAEASTSRSFGGTGLGLAICQQLTDLMHGEIGVRSAVGQGSTFWFTARLRPQTAPLAAAPSFRPSPVTPRAADISLRVLVAEDNVVNQRVAASLLRKLGHEVAIAENGLEALSAIARERFDVVLMDGQMPRMDGYDATRRLRASEPAGTRLPVVALTAETSADVRSRCLDAGMDDCLTKPLRLAELDRVLRLVRPASADESAGRAGDLPIDESASAPGKCA